jgi:hypothetical protein
MPGGGVAFGSSGRCVRSNSASRPLTSCVCTACHRSLRYVRLRGWSASSGVSVVPGGRFSGLDKCGTPSDGAAGSAAAACTVPPGAGAATGPGAGAAAVSGTGAGAGAATARGSGDGAGAGGGGAGATIGITGSGTTGSANAGSAIAGAARITAAITLGPPTRAVNTVALTSIVTDMPPSRCRGCATYWVLQSGRQDCYICGCCDEAVNRNSRFGNTFHLEFSVTHLTTPQLWCSNALRALDNVI